MTKINPAILTQITFPYIRIGGKVFWEHMSENKEYIGLELNLIFITICAAVQIIEEK